MGYIYLKLRKKNIYLKLRKKKYLRYEKTILINKLWVGKWEHKTRTSFMSCFYVQDNNKPTKKKLEGDILNDFLVSKLIFNSPWFNLVIHISNNNFKKYTLEIFNNLTIIIYTPFKLFWFFKNMKKKVFFSVYHVLSNDFFSLFKYGINKTIKINEKHLNIFL